ncbi:MAG: hypothetical protein ACREQA_17360 [Candidatus Binatia bacterium]
MIKRIRTRDERVQFESFVAAILSGHSTDEITANLKNLSVPVPYRLRMKVLYSRLDAFEILTKLGDSRIRQAGPRTRGFSFTWRLGRRERGSGAVNFTLLPTKQEKVQVLVTVSTYDQWLPLLRFLRSQYPLLVPIFLSQQELMESALALPVHTPQFAVRVREITARESLGVPSRKQLKSVREWTDEELRTALAIITDRRQIIGSLTLAFYRQVGENIDVTPAALCKLAKSGQIEVTGNFGLAWSTIVEYVARVGNQKLQFYSRRGLRERKYEPAPLQISFKSPVLADLQEVRRLVATLSKYPNAMHSVQHGNPYAHLRISDVYDGSSFDIWAVRDNAIAVIPGLKATEAAIERLIHYIFDSFREGEVRELGRHQ